MLYHALQSTGPSKALLELLHLCFRASAGAVAPQMHSLTVAWCTISTADERQATTSWFCCTTGLI